MKLLKLSFINLVPNLRKKKSVSSFELHFYCKKYTIVSKIFWNKKQLEMDSLWISVEANNTYLTNILCTFMQKIKDLKPKE